MKPHDIKLAEDIRLAEMEAEDLRALIVKERRDIVTLQAGKTEWQDTEAGPALIVRFGAADCWSCPVAKVPFLITKMQIGLNGMLAELRTLERQTARQRQQLRSMLDGAEWNRGIAVTVRSNDGQGYTAHAGDRSRICGPYPTRAAALDRARAIIEAMLPGDNALWRNDTLHWQADQPSPDAGTGKRYRVEVQADRSGTWASNQLEFATIAEATAYGEDLAARWSSVQDWRVAEVDA